MSGTRGLTTLLALCTALGAGAVRAEEPPAVIPVDRDPYLPYLLGRVDFDAMSASSYPGTRYDSRLPFRGLIVDTYFRGQLPILRKTGRRTYGALAHEPETPLKEGGFSSERIMSTLMVTTHTPPDTGAFLLSRVYEYEASRREMGYGFGSIALKFSNDQFVLGFELVPPPTGTKRAPHVQLRFLDVAGHPVGPALELSAFGTYTFRDAEEIRRIRGVEVINMGLVPIGLDTIVFELPLVIG